MQLWITRSNGGEFLPLFLGKKVIAVGWCLNDNFTGLNKEGIKRLLEKNYPNNKKSIPAWVGFCDTFVNKMKKEDYVLTYDASARVYYLGQIVGEYIYDKDIDAENPHTRQVKWFTKTISRDLLSNSTKNSLGSPQTIFKLSTEQKDEIIKILNEEHVETEDEIVEKNKENSETLFENAKENLKDAINSLSPNDMEELVKELLNAMGYVATRSLKGPDRSIDVFASPDGLGLEEPRIFVEVKHRGGQMGAPAIRTFLGGRQNSDKCLYVSTGGFTKEAKYEAERSSIPITLIDIEKLSTIISRYYDNFTVEGKSLLPLKKVYLPV